MKSLSKHILLQALTLSKADISMNGLPHRTREEDAEKQSGKRKGADNADALRTDKHKVTQTKNPSSQL